jgi:hypothetical protein
VRAEMTISFKAFVLVKGFNVPVKASAVATSLNFHPPVSLRALIGTAGPYEPINVSYTTTVEGTGFLWYDEANLPPWIWKADDSPYGPPDPIRQATRFDLKIWDAPGNNVIIDEPIPYNVPNGSGLPAVYDAGVLDGSYTYQVTAFNQFGTASIPKTGPIQITPPAPGPNIAVVTVGANEFQVKGTGFEDWAGQTVDINVDIGPSFSVSQEPVPTARVDDQGGFNTNIQATICGGRPGAPLRFSVTEQAAAGFVGKLISNLVLTTCSKALPSDPILHRCGPRAPVG